VKRFCFISLRIRCEAFASVRFMFEGRHLHALLLFSGNIHFWALLNAHILCNSRKKQEWKNEVQTQQRYESYKNTFIICFRPRAQTLTLACFISFFFLSLFRFCLICLGC